VYAIEDGEELFHWALLRAGGSAELMLNSAYDEGERPAHPDPVRTTGHIDTGLFIGCPDPDAAYRELVAKGLKCQPPHTAGYGMRQLFFTDPDGYGITLQWPVNADERAPDKLEL
jgi:uncharacterized glyoxalase superfamily protein PhnB